jgi:hypothetical protein
LTLRRRALIATMMVDSDMNTVPSAGVSTVRLAIGFYTLKLDGLELSPRSRLTRPPPVSTGRRS